MKYIENVTKFEEAENDIAVINKRLKELKRRLDRNKCAMELFQKQAWHAESELKRLNEDKAEGMEALELFQNMIKA